MSAARE